MAVVELECEPKAITGMDGIWNYMRTQNTESYKRYVTIHHNITNLFIVIQECGTKIFKLCYLGMYDIAVSSFARNVMWSVLKMICVQFSPFLFIELLSAYIDHCGSHKNAP